MKWFWASPHAPAVDCEIGPTTKHPERPIERESEDALERGGFVDRLLAALVSDKTHKSTGIVVGITGPWGSGKSSVLNLLRERIGAKYPDALVLSFDPWLVSGRNDLITEFLSEFVTSIRHEPRFKKLKNVAKTVSKYATLLAPIAGLVNTHAGIAVKSGASALESALSRDETLHSIRERLMKELDSVDVPIIVLIDELDRVEDDEIRVVTQLVRSVADFPGVSYVLAYDFKRVADALGRDVPERGKAYLEKIVQLQIPLPVTLDQELRQLLLAELRSLQSDAGLPENFSDLERFRKLLAILIPELIGTPRDIKRLVGAYRALTGLTRGEVDAIDLLGYSTLLVKAPETLERIRSDPDDYVDNPLSAATLYRRSQGVRANAKSGTNESIENLSPPSERSAALSLLLTTLFPALGERRPQWEYPNQICRRRALITALRLGLSSGTWSRQRIVDLVHRDPAQIAAEMNEAFKEDTLGALVDRLDDLYLSLEVKRLPFWAGVSQFLMKRDPEWLQQYVPMPDLIRDFADILLRAVERNESTRRDAASVFSMLADSGDISLVAKWLRHHVFCYGLFGGSQRGGERHFMDPQTVLEVARALTDAWRRDHLERRLLPRLWDLEAVWAMIDCDTWDHDCRSEVDRLLRADSRAVDGLTLMFFGGLSTVDRQSIERVCDFQTYMGCVHQRIADRESHPAHESLVFALRKAKAISG